MQDAILGHVRGGRPITKDDLFKAVEDKGTYEEFDAALAALAEQGRIQVSENGQLIEHVATC